MFNRRPRHCYQAGFIVVLLLGMMYLLYINNEVNGKLSTLESKNKRYHAQHQSLSSQLQGKLVKEGYFARSSKSIFFGLIC